MHLSTVDFVSSESGPWVFNSKPSVMSLSLNNKSMSFEGEGVTISFEHQNNSMVGIEIKPCVVFDVLLQACEACEPHCVFWDSSLQLWSDEGCKVN